MTKDMTYLAWSALLTSAIWIPYITSLVMANGFLTPANYKDPTPRPAPNWGLRANRTHINAVESFAPFAALVIVAHITDTANDATAMWAGVYFWSRVAYTIVYLLGIPYLRTIVFTASFVSVVAIFLQVIR